MLLCLQSVSKSRIRMFAVEVLIPETDGLVSPPATIGRAVSSTPLADAPLLGSRNQFLILLDIIIFINNWQNIKYDYLSYIFFLFFF